MSYYLLRICPLNISGLWLTSWVHDRNGKWKHGFYNIWEDGGGSKRGFLPINIIKGDANSYEARKMYMFSNLVSGVIWAGVWKYNRKSKFKNLRNTRILISHAWITVSVEARHTLRNWILWNAAKFCAFKLFCRIFLAANFSAFLFPNKNTLFKSS